MSYDYIIGAGHTPSGTAGSGAIGILDESNCTREVAPLIADGLNANGKSALYISFDRGNSYNIEDCHYRINYANNDNCGMYIEIHFNASGVGTSGTEVLCPSNASTTTRNIAGNISAQISKDLGTTNLGIITRDNLCIFSHAQVPVLLVECLYIDSETDTNVYNAQKIANSIVIALTGKGIDVSNISGTEEKKWKLGWNEDQVGWFYVLDVDNKIYYTSSDGWQYIDGYWYIFNDIGYALQNEWYKDIVKEKWYYLDKNCQCVINKWLLRSREGTWYYLNDNGEMISDTWLDYMDKKYYLKHDGTLAMSETITINDKEYIFDENGEVKDNKE